MLIAALVVAGGAVYLFRRRRPAKADPTRDLASLVVAVARHLRAGAGLHEAIHRGADQAPPSVAGIHGISSALRSGEEIRNAVATWPASITGRSGILKRGGVIGRAPCQPLREDVELFNSALVFGSEFGGDAPTSLEAVAETLLARAELNDETAALTAQAKASLVILCGLPVVGIAMFAAIDTQVVTTLFTTRVGQLCLALGVAFDICAVLVARVLINRALR